MKTQGCTVTFRPCSANSIKQEELLIGLETSGDHLKVVMNVNFILLSARMDVSHEFIYIKSDKIRFGCYVISSLGWECG